MRADVEDLPRAPERRRGRERRGAARDGGRRGGGRRRGFLRGRSTVLRRPPVGFGGVDRAGGHVAVREALPGLPDDEDAQRGDVELVSVCCCFERERKTEEKESVERVSSVVFLLKRKQTKKTLYHPRQRASAAPAASAPLPRRGSSRSPRPWPPGPPPSRATRRCRGSRCRRHRQSFRRRGTGRLRGRTSLPRGSCSLPPFASSSSRNSRARRWRGRGRPGAPGPPSPRRRRCLLHCRCLLLCSCPRRRRHCHSAAGAAPAG